MSTAQQSSTSTKTITGADILIGALVRNGGDTIFAYPGGASMPLHQALTRRKDQIRTILPRHEQGGGFAAQGYSRTTDNVGLCMATSGPGATNLVTTIADAKMDSVPLIAITGQVPQAVIGTDAFQETPIVEICRAVTKHYYMITAEDHTDPASVREALESGCSRWLVTTAATSLRVSVSCCQNLHSWSQTGNQSTLWCLAGSLAVWSNLDPRAFIGWIVLLAYLIGMAIGQKSGRSSLHENASLKGLAMATGAGFVALMVNPFGWHAVLSPIQLYGIEMPALARYVGRVQLPHELQFVPLFDPAVWKNLNLHTIAALTIAVVAAVTSVMNFSRLNIGLFATYVTVLGLSIACSHELGALALVSCVLASLNGQDWYRAHCRQEYTIETIEVLWSRAGRAITVLGFAAIAFLAISGRLMGPDGRRVGLGFSPLLAATIEAARDEVEQLPEGHIFTFRLDQADVLLWHGVPSFVDSRVGVFAGDDDILKTHNKARHALRRSRGEACFCRSRFRKCRQRI